MIVVSRKSAGVVRQEAKGPVDPLTPPLAKKPGLSTAEIQSTRARSSLDHRASPAVVCAGSNADNAGAAGYIDTALDEIITNVGLKHLDAFIGHLALDHVRIGTL